MGMLHPASSRKPSLRSRSQTSATACPAWRCTLTLPERLAGAAAASRASGVKSVFTLASGLLPDEVFVSGLPHGVYVSGDVSTFEEKLELERSTPHNFFILRPEPAAEASVGGVYGFTREVQPGTAVALPQLAADFATIGGRGQEQADRLIELYAKSLPPPELTP